jgi:DNA helicase-2/ATP-dependent DNA helicase PcrA
VPRYRDTSWPAAGSEGAGDTAGDGQPPGHRPFAPGEKVVHPTFGRGTVVAVRQSGDDQEVTVAFTGKGVRKLLVSLAALERD